MAEQARCDICGYYISECKRRRNAEVIDRDDGNEWRLKGDDIDMRLFADTLEYEIGLEVFNLDKMQVHHAKSLITMLQEAIAHIEELQNG